MTLRSLAPSHFSKPPIVFLGVSIGSIADILFGGWFPRLRLMRIFLKNYRLIRNDILDYLDSSRFARWMPVRSRDRFVLSLEFGGMHFTRLSFFTMPHLPIELYSVIIANLRPEEDLDTLKSSALSFRQLTLLSHQQLFSHIIIRSPEKCCSLFHRFGGSSISFRALLDDSPHIASMVRCLELYDRPLAGWYHHTPCPRHHNFNVDKSWISEDEDLQFCLPRLTNLEALTSTIIVLSNSNSYYPLPAGLVKALHNAIQLPSLIHIDMQGIICHILPKLGSQVKHLVLNDSFELHTNASLSKNRTLVCLESLLIEEQCPLSCLDLRINFEGSSIPFGRLKKFHVFLSESLDQELPLLLKVLHQARDSIEEFVLSPYIDGKNFNRVCHFTGLIRRVASSLSAQEKFQDFDQPLNLSNLKSLKRFHVYLEFNNDGGFVLNSSFPWFINVLNNSSPDHLTLEEINITLELDYNEERDDLLSSLSSVGNVLLSGRYPQLRSMRVFVRTFGSTTDAALELLESSTFAQRMRSNNRFDLTFELGGLDFIWSQMISFWTIFRFK